MYQIVRIGDEDEFRAAEEFRIEHYLWGSTYRPEVTGALAYLEGRAYILRMVCRESDPRRVYVHSDDPVCKDSCMEAFINFRPGETSPGYISFEMNALGTLHSSFGANRYDRVFLRELGVLLPQPRAQIFPDRWQIDLRIPLTLIAQLYGVSDFPMGYKMLGNFYKCGDETASEHYGAWSEVRTEKPDFHQQAYFGDLMMA